MCALYRQPDSSSISDGLMGERERHPNRTARSTATAQRGPTNSMPAQSQLRLLVTILSEDPRFEAHFPPEGRTSGTGLLELPAALELPVRATAPSFVRKRAELAPALLREYRYKIPTNK